MKRFVKILGLVAGVAAVAWAMRDRFISVAASREPEAPVFRATTPSPRAAGIETVDGIGPVFASRLKGAGLANVRDLAGASPDTVAEAAGVSAARARSWIEQARSLN